MRGSIAVLVCRLISGAWLASFSIGFVAAADYCVVVSQATLDDTAWRPVVEALVAKHRAEVIRYADKVDDALSTLREQFPRYVCFVAQPTETSVEYVAHVHRLMRQLDDDPYTDALWGIVTGYDAANALRIARQADPLVVHRVAAGTEVALEMCDEGVWYCELNQGKFVRKQAGSEAVIRKGAADSTAALVDTLNKYNAQLFVTSGHATERDWQIGFSYRNGEFRCKKGQLFGLDTKKQQYPVNAPNPKVYLPVGNCLMGHIDGPDAMAAAFMNSAGVTQMIGYTVPTWYGYGGWGLLDYFVEQPGRYTLAEAFFVNHQALLHRLDSNFPGLAAAEPQTINGKIEANDTARENGLTTQDAQGLLYDRDVVAFYGDPAWSATMAVHECAFDQSLQEKNGRYQFEIKPNRGEKSFEPVNKNGAQRGGRPIIAMLPKRIDVKTLKIVAGADLKPLVTDNFILVPLPQKCDPTRAYRVDFEAAMLGE